MDEIYKANDKLADILLSHGFIETTSKRNHLKGKRSFKKSKHSSLEVFFDYSNIKVIKSAFVMEEFNEMDSDQLKMLLLYFELDIRSRNEITGSGVFSFNKINQHLLLINAELEVLMNSQKHQKRKIKLERIMTIYNTINIL